MAPIEVLFAIIVFIFLLIGVVRGFLRELGVMTIMVFLLFFLNLFHGRLDTGLAKAASLGTQYMSISTDSVFKAGFFILVVMGTAFISYQGETLAFGGQPPIGLLGIMFGALTGLLNGYLIAGSVWYFMDKYGYPFAWMGFSAEHLSDFAKTLVTLLPIPFLGQPVLLGQSMLLYLSALLLLARIMR